MWLIEHILTLLFLFSTLSTELSPIQDHNFDARPPEPKNAYANVYWISVIPFAGAGCDPTQALPNSAIIHRSFNEHDNYVTDGECHPVNSEDSVGSVQIIGGSRCRVSLHSGTDCEGWRWTPSNTPCDDYVYGSARIWCWDGRAYGPEGIGKRDGEKCNETEAVSVAWSG